jgi:carbon monoxide dehydrogenase subunit G
MHLSKTVALRLPAQQAWSALSDVRLIAQCIPGARIDRETAPGEFTGAMSLKLGPVSTEFAAQMKITRDDAAMQGVLEGSGVDRRTSSRSKGKVNYGLRPADEGTGSVLAIDADVSLQGMLANFASAALMSEVLSRLADAFAQALEARISVDQAAPPVVESAAAPPPQVAPAPQMNMGKVLAASLLAWIRGFFRLS